MLFFLVKKTDKNTKISEIETKLIDHNHENIWFKLFWSDFEEDGTQNYLVFQPMYRYFKRVSGVGDVSYLFFWKTKGYSNGNITAPFTSDYKLNLELIFLVLKPK